MHPSATENWIGLAAEDLHKKSEEPRTHSLSESFAIRLTGDANQATTIYFVLPEDEVK